jgi:predicted NUDIX family NTP pyrophosphohydrolase
MAAKQSAGLLVYRHRAGGLEIFLVHPGGPFWAKKDAGAWSIPKGEFRDDEEKLAAARREFHEETGFPLDGIFVELAPVKQSGGKQVFAWAVEQDLDAAAVRSNSFSMEWPPGSGRTQEFPEIDRAAWFDVPLALVKILKGQQPLVLQLLARLGIDPP